MHRIRLIVLMQIVLLCSLCHEQKTFKYSLTDLQPSLGTTSLGATITSSWGLAINKNGAVAGDFIDSSGNQWCFTYYSYLIVGGKIVSHFS